MSSWSKEAIFGLLAIFVAILMPASAFFGRYLFLRWQLRYTPKFEGKQYMKSYVCICPALKKTDVEESGAVVSNTSGTAPGGRRRRTRRRSGKTFLIFM
jgi:hypothetical protein